MSTRASPPGGRRFPDLDSFESIPDVSPADDLSQGLYGVSDDPTYGFARTNPILVGGGPAGERRFLSWLTLDGRPILFERQGSVCGHGRFLDLYAVAPAGGGEWRFLYLDMYTCDHPRAPLGFGIAAGRCRR